MVKAAIAVRVGPSSACGVEQRCCPEDVGFEERHGVFDASVYVAFSRQVHHGIEGVLCKQPFDQRAVLDVAFDESVVGIRLDVAKVFQVASVSQCIEVDHLRIGTVGQQLANHVGTDETGTAGYEDRVECAHFLKDSSIRGC